MLDTLYDRFLADVSGQTVVTQAVWRTFAGQRFLYVHTPLSAGEAARLLDERARSLVDGTRLRVQCVYVRSEGSLHVYRFRFLVPDEKMFCCGNRCADCVLLRGV